MAHGFCGVLAQHHSLATSHAQRSGKRLGLHPKGSPDPSPTRQTARHIQHIESCTYPQMLQEYTACTFDFFLDPCHPSRRASSGETDDERLTACPTRDTTT